jgi:hypothetical protein
VQKSQRSLRISDDLDVIFMTGPLNIHDIADRELALRRGDDLGLQVEHTDLLQTGPLQWPVMAVQSQPSNEFQRQGNEGSLAIGSERPGPDLEVVSGRRMA